MSAERQMRRRKMRAAGAFKAKRKARQAEQLMTARQQLGAGIASKQKHALQLRGKRKGKTQFNPKPIQE